MSKIPKFFLMSALIPAPLFAEPRVTVGVPAGGSLASSTISAPVPLAWGPVANAWGVAYDPVTRRVFASVPTSGSISMLNAENGQSLGSFWSESGAVVHGLAVDVANRRLWFLDSATDQVRSRMIDSSGAGPAFALPGSGLKRPTDLAVDPVRGELFIADSAQNSVVRMAFDGTVRGIWSEAGTEDAWGVAVVPGGLVYCSSYSQGTVRSWNPETGATALVASGISGPRGLTIDRFGRLLCLASGSGTVLKLDSSSPTATPFTGYPNGRSFRCDDTTDEDDDLLPDAWELAFSGLGSLGSASDPDKDGQSAFFEAAFGGRPDRGDGSALKADPPTAAAGLLQIRFPVRQSDGPSYRIWVSTNLQTWWVPAVTITDGIPSGGYAERRAYLDRSVNGIPAASPVFFRIETFKLPDF